MDATFVILLTFLCINQVCKHNYIIIARFAASANDEVILISVNTKVEVAIFQRNMAKQSRICIFICILNLLMIFFWTRKSLATIYLLSS